MTDEQLRELISLLDNRQVPDYATVRGLTLGDLRAIRALAATPEPTLDAERLAVAIERVAIEDRDRTLAGDYRPNTYAEHAARLIAAARLHERTEPQEEPRG